MGEALSPGATRVEVTLTPVDGDTDLWLSHSELPSTQAEEHAKGWALFVGERLGAAVANASHQPLATKR